MQSCARDICTNLEAVDTQLRRCLILPQGSNACSLQLSFDVQMSFAMEYCDLDQWHEKLSEVLAACHLEGLPDRRDALPLRGGQTVVFKIREEAIVKFYSKDLQVILFNLYKLFRVA